MTPPTTVTGYVPDTLLQKGFSVPDDASTVWPAPHDPKLDTIEVLRAVFAQLGMQDIAISKDGAFTAAALKNAEGASVPYVTVTRSADLAVRRGVGNLVGVFGAGDPTMVDPAGIVPPGGAVAVRGEFSNTTIDITIADKNPHRADQLYIVIKMLMIAARPDFNRLGYIDVRRVNGNDGAAIEVNSPTPYLVFTRSLTYVLDYPDLICDVDACITLIKQSLHPDPNAPDVTITTDL